MLSRSFFLALIMSTAFGLAHAETASLEFTSNVNKSIQAVATESLPEEDTPQTLLEARRQARRAANSVRDALNAEGYFDPQIDFAVEAGPPLKPRVRVNPGARFNIGTITVDYKNTPPPPDIAEKAFSRLEPATGEKAIPSKIIDGERQITQLLQQEGYPFVKADDRETIGDRDTATIDVTYAIKTGPRISFGSVIYPANIRTKASHLRRLVPFKEGERYTPAQLALLNARLSETRLFSSATATLAEVASRKGENGDDIRDVIIKAVERPRNTIATGVRVSTAEGFGLTGELTRRNFTRRGDLLIATLDIAELKTELDIKWRRPNEFGYGRGLVLGAFAATEDTDAFQSKSVGVSAGYDVERNASTSFSYGVQAETVSETDDFGKRNLQIASAYASARVDRADSVLDPRKGWRAEARVQPSYAFGGGDSQYVRTSAQVRGYLPLDEDGKYVIAGRLRGGNVFGASAADIPTDDRFYAGGGGSVRGYGYQAIGPRSSDNDPLGGKALLEGSIEARFKVRRKIGAVAFVDAGSVSSSEQPELSDVQIGAGVGVRYATPVGPIRFDVAVPLDKRSFDDPFQIYISIGQAF